MLLRYTCIATPPDYCTKVCIFQDSTFKNFGRWACVIVTPAGRSACLCVCPPPPASPAALMSPPQRFLLPCLSACHLLPGVPLPPARSTLEEPCPPPPPPSPWRPLAACLPARRPSARSTLEEPGPPPPPRPTASSLHPGSFIVSCQAALHPSPTTRVLLLRG